MTETRPVWAQEAEVGVLGAILIDAENALIQVQAVLTADDFYAERHRRVFRAMEAIASRGMPVDPPLLLTELESRGEAEATDAFNFIAELLEAVPTAANVEYHARTVRDFSQRRQLIAAGTEIVRFSSEPSDMATADLVDRAERLVFACDGLSAKTRPVQVGKILMPIFEQMETMQPGSLSGLNSGFRDINEMTGGLQRGDLIVLAGRPSMGKTAMATSIMLHAGITENELVLFYSCEMAKMQIVKRMLCHEAMVNLRDLDRGMHYMSNDNANNLARAAAILNTAPMYIMDRDCHTIPEQRAHTRRVAQEHKKIGLIVVDHLGHVKARGENRNHEIGYITSELKKIAIENDVPVLLLCQLSRETERRTNHRPHLGDLRDSGNIEQDADLVAFMYREEYYMTKPEAQERNLIGKAEFIISKQRNGPTGIVDLHFIAECARFEGMKQNTYMGAV